MKQLIILILLLFAFENSNSQVVENANNPWIVGFGVNAIDDSGKRLGKLFDFNDNYFFKNPYQFSVEKRFRDDFGLEVLLSYNTFEKGKIFNEGILEEDIDFFASDLSFKYYFTNLFLDKYRSYFEGFLLTGIGESFYDWKGTTNFNLGGGFLFYISNSIRLNLVTIAKLSLIKNDNTGSNYLQYNAGIIYRLPVKQ